MVYDVYEMVIGLEVHVELKTETKIFCSCSTAFGAEPNTQCCPVCMGLPGALPTLNKKAVEYAIKAGLALNCDINRYTRMDRKNYFYPDLPKAYQISQYDLPLCKNGYVEIESSGKRKKIGITRIHLEEDAGKLIHDADAGTLIDCNRCGVPLIEIVSEPDIRSAEEAVTYVKSLRSILLYTGVSDVKMQEGSLRCDVNLSVRRREDSMLGNRCELKNINSFRFIAEAIEYEFRRQVDAVERGELIVIETRRFDQNDGKTYAMRPKEDAGEYRFFPEPDIPAFLISDDYISKIAAELPMLPDAKKEMLMVKYGLTKYDAELLTENPSRCEYYEFAASKTNYPKILANIMISELNECACLPDAEMLAQICNFSGEERINSNTAKKLLTSLLNGDKRTPEDIIREENLEQISSVEALMPFVEEAIAGNQKSVNDYKAGKSAALKAIVGSVMRGTSGRANAVKVSEILADILK